MPIRLTPVIKVLLISAFAAFLMIQTGDQFFGTHLASWFALVPASVISQHRYWQIFTFFFVHRDVMHLFFDLLMLALIGAELEMAWGSRRFLAYIASCTIGAGIFYLLLGAFVVGGAHVPMTGASSAIYGLLLAYGLIYGERVLLFMMLFPMKAKHFVWILALLELMTTVFSSVDALSGLAHLVGIPIGFAFLWVRASVKVVSRKRDRKGFSWFPWRKKKNHLKLIVNNDKSFGSDDEDSEETPKTWH